MLSASTVPYIFTVTASQVVGSVTNTGSASISITVTSSPLRIILSNCNGDIPPNIDYTINAIMSRDPDSDSSTDDTVDPSLTFLWTCLNDANDTTCLGSDSQPLISDGNGSSLILPATRLIQGATLDLTCTISKDIRTASATIILSVLTTPITSTVTIATDNIKINP
jgi:hypothetical protein